MNRTDPVTDPVASADPRTDGVGAVHPGRDDVGTGGTVRCLPRDVERFAFRPHVEAALTLDGACMLDPGPASDPEALARLADALPDVRRAVMESFSSEEFQRVVAAFCAELAVEHFAEPALFQRTPSVRLHLPGALGTSWHVDNWYGHVAASTTFWIPLNEVLPGAGVRFVDDPALLEDIEARLGRTLELADVNRLCERAGREVPCPLDRYLAFDARTLHGSVGNTSDGFRCSIDLRGVPERHGVGGKPSANYRRVPGVAPEDGAAWSAEEGGAAGPVDAAPYADGAAVKYVSGANGTSAKYQHVLAEAYAADHGLRLVRNEAEIEAVASRPVLAAYAARRVPDPDGYDHVVLGSVDQLPWEADLARALLERCTAHGVRLHFAAEDRVFPDSIGAEECLARLGRRALEPPGRPGRPAPVAA